MDFKYSPTAILTYDYCPRKFKFLYIDKFSPKSKPKHVTDGATLHSYFELFYKGMPDINEMNEQYFKDYLNRIPNEFKEEFKEDINNFLAFNRRVFDSTDKKFYKPLAIEEKVYDKDLNLVGVIDCVFTDGRNILVLDFKTGKPKDDIPSDYEFQLGTYVHLWKLSRPDLPATHVGLLYTKGGCTPLVYEVKKELVENMFKKVEDTKCKVNNGIFPKCENKFKCKRCEVAEYCLGVLTDDISD
jgi:CRISPR/Cas system-associated exonuclease Cas4 (RecB family)